MNDDQAVLAEVEHRLYRELLAAYADEMTEDTAQWVSTWTPTPNLTKKETSR